MTSAKRRSFNLDEIIVGGALLLLIVTSIGASLGDGYYLEQGILASRLSGYGALAFLANSILFGALLRAGTWLGLQVDEKVSARIAKNSGIASAISAILHSAISVTGFLHGNWSEVLDQSYLNAGFLSLVVLALLLVFSVKPLMSRVEWHLWKPTFRLSIAAAVLAFCHVLYAPFSSLHWTLGLFLVAIAIFLLRFCPPRCNARRSRKDGPSRLPEPKSPSAE